MAATEHDLVGHMRDVRDMWQGQVLAEAEGRMMLVVCSMLAHSYDLAMPVLLAVIQPKCWDHERRSLRPPFLTSIGKVDKSGAVVADAMLFDGALITRDKPVFSSTIDYRDELRRLADRCRLSDEDRRQFFICASNWLASDRRLDPSMNPVDPDAKRLVH